MRSGPVFPGFHQADSSPLAVDWRILRESARAAKRALRKSAREAARQRDRQMDPYRPLRIFFTSFVVFWALILVFSGPEAQQAVWAVLIEAIGVLRDTFVRIFNVVQ